MVQPLVAKFGERHVMLAGFWFNAAGFLAYAVAPTGLFFWSAIPIGALGGLSGPPMQGLMIRWVMPIERATSGRTREHPGRCFHDWAVTVQFVVREFHQPVSVMAFAGHPVSARGGIDDDFNDHRVARDDGATREGDRASNPVSRRK